MKPVFVPRVAAPTAVLAPEPPEMIVAGPMAPNRSSARALVDELHRALRHALRRQEGLVRAGDDIHDGVAEDEKIEGSGHAGVLFRGAEARRRSASVQARVKPRRPTTRSSGPPRSPRPPPEAGRR